MNVLKPHRLAVTQRIAGFRKATEGGRRTHITGSTHAAGRTAVAGLSFQLAHQVTHLNAHLQTIRRLLLDSGYCAKFKGSQSEGRGAPDGKNNSEEPPRLSAFCPCAGPAPKSVAEVVCTVGLLSDTATSEMFSVKNVHTARRTISKVACRPPRPGPKIWDLGSSRPLNPKFLKRPNPPKLGPEYHRNRKTRFEH